MTTIDNQNVFPYIAPKSTELRLQHFDDTVFKANATSFIYKFVDAICGDVGAGSLLKDTLLSRFSTALETLYFHDLDYIFGGMHFLQRYEGETYPFDPHLDVLTSDQWDEVFIKDSWYRARIKDFFEAATLGGTPNGIRAAVQAGTSANCEVFEVWRYKDSYGLTQALGRAPVTTRSEFVVRPHKTSLPARQKRLLRQMLDRIAPADTIVTIDVQGLAVNTPVHVSSASADSTYFEVQKEVQGSPLLKDISEPELLAIDLRPSEQWLFSDSPEIAPYAAFNITQEYGYYYLISGGARSPIDSVQYLTSTDGETFTPEVNYEEYESYREYTSWKSYDQADSPDNFPGGKYGLTPTQEPALDASGRPYEFAYSSQQEYVEEKKAEVLASGGQADDFRYRLSKSLETSSRKSYTPDLAVAYSTPARDTTVTSGWVKDNVQKRTSTLQSALGLVQNGVGINARIVL